jgi:GT2 family glycosyltransferase
MGGIFLDGNGGGGGGHTQSVKYVREKEENSCN